MTNGQNLCSILKALIDSNALSSPFQYREVLCIAKDSFNISAAGQEYAVLKALQICCTSTASEFEAFRQCRDPRKSSSIKDVRKAWQFKLESDERIAPLKNQERVTKQKKRGGQGERAGENEQVPYTIQVHQHRFSAWAAGRAATVTGCRFKVEQAKIILEMAGLNQLLSKPEELPSPQDMDAHHKEWRNSVIRAAGDLGLTFTHGVAAKLINIYLKAGFVCGGYHAHANVHELHPPIDDVLLKKLARQNIGGLRHVWNEARRIKWSKFNSEQYQAVIDALRVSMPDDPMWKVEKYWRGYQ